MTGISNNRIKIPVAGARRVILRTAVLFLVPAIAVTAAVGLQAAEKPEAVIGKDLRSLEVVLDNLLARPGSGPFVAPFGNNCWGIHLEGYGVLFYACRAMPYQSLIDMSRFGSPGDRTRSNFSLFGRTNERSSPVSQLEQDEIKSQLQEFFGNYATGLTLLEPEERVSVMVRIEGPFMGGQTVPYVFASASGGDLDKLDRARDPVDEAGKRVSFESLDLADNGRDRKLYIMAQIIAANLEIEEVSAIYLDDFGALFLADNGHFPLGFGPSSLELFGEVESSGSVEEVRRTGPDSTVSFFQRYHQAVVAMRPDSARLKQRAERMGDVFVDALAKYGRTLERLSRDDRLGLIVTTQAVIGPGPRSIKIYVDNADLIDYRRNRIDRDELIKRVTIKYF